MLGLTFYCDDTLNLPIDKGDGPKLTINENETLKSAVQTPVATMCKPSSVHKPWVPVRQTSVVRDIPRHHEKYTTSRAARIILYTKHAA
jgi:hypothetical protein